MSFVAQHVKCFASCQRVDNSFPVVGCNIDYKGSHVNPETFMAVLTGDKQKVKELTGQEDAKVPCLYLCVVVISGCLNVWTRCSSVRRVALA